MSAARQKKRKQGGEPSQPVAMGHRRDRRVSSEQRRKAKALKRRKIFSTIFAALAVVGIGVALVVNLRGVDWFNFSFGNDSPAPTPPPTPKCFVTTPQGTSFDLRPVQAGNAGTIAAVGLTKGLPTEAVAIALATASQESSLINIDYGDRDSVGLFQQRPSQGWGTVAQLLDPTFAAGAFYDKLVKVPNYATIPLTEAAQKVQKSAYPDAYAQYEDKSKAFAAALTGDVSANLSCVLTGYTQPAPSDPAGAVSSHVQRDFLGDVALTTLPDGAISLDTAKLAKAAGRDAVNVDWAVAQWAVANAADLGIDTVTTHNMVWTREGAWSAVPQPTVTPGSTATAAPLPDVPGVTMTLVPAGPVATPTAG